MLHTDALRGSTRSLVRRRRDFPDLTGSNSYDTFSRRNIDREALGRGTHEKTAAVEKLPACSMESGSAKPGSRPACELPAPSHRVGGGDDAAVDDMIAR